MTQGSAGTPAGVPDSGSRPAVVRASLPTAASLPITASLPSAEPGPTSILSAPAAGPVPPPAPGRSTTPACPYPGLSSFEAAAENYFFGRTDLVAEALARLAQRAAGQGPLVLVGASGAGKSSVLRAGLLPAVGRAGLGAVLPAGAPQVTLAPTEHPLAELAMRVTAALGAPALGWVLRDAMRAEPERFAAVLADLLAASTGDQPADHPADQHADRPRRRLLLAVDQFEEIFTLCVDEAERVAFIRALCAAAAGPSAPAVVVLAVRGDFYLRCVAYPELAEVLQHGQVVVGPMEQSEVRDAIVEPARLAGVTVEPALVDLLLDDLAEAGGRASAGAGRGLADTGVLPLLAHVLRVTWDLRTDRTLRVGTYRDAGRLAGALAKTADDLLAGLDDAGRGVARMLLPRLVRVGEGGQVTRRPVRTEALLDEIEADGPAARALLDRLVAARLVEADGDRVQIVHEALLRSWPRLRGWIELDRAEALVRQQLDDRAGEWERHGEDPSFLFTGLRLAAAREQIEPGGRRRSLGGRAGRFYDAAVAQERAATAAARRRTTRLRVLVAGLAVLSLLAVSLTGIFVDQRSAAATIRDEARSKYIAGLAEDQAFSRAEVGTHLALAAREFADTSEARSAVLGAQTPTRLKDAHAGPIHTVAYSRDGRLIASGGEDATAALWDGGESTGGLISRLPAYHGTDGEPYTVGSVAFSRDGRILAVGTADGAVRLWNSADPAHPKPGAALPTSSADPETGAVGLAFSPTADLLAVGGYGSTVQLFDIGDPAAPRAVDVLGDDADRPAHTMAVRDLEFSPDGTRILTGGVDGRAILWAAPSESAAAHPVAELVNPEDSEPLEGFRSPVAFGTDGVSLYRAFGATVEYFRPGEDGMTPEYRGHTIISGPYVLADIVSLAGGAIAVVSANAKISIGYPAWDLDEFTALPLSQQGLALAVSPDGRRIVSGSADNDLRVHQWSGRLVDDGITGMLAVDAGGPDGLVFVASNYDIMAYRSDPSGREDAELLGWINDAHPFNATADQLNKGVGSTPTVGLELRSSDQVLVTASREGYSLWDVSPGGLAGWTREPASGAAALNGAARPSARPTPLASVTTGENARNSSARSLVSIDLSPDGTRLAAGDNRGDIHLWDVSDPRHPVLAGERQNAHPETNEVLVAFSADGGLLASSGNDQKVRLWDPDDLGAGPLAEGGFGGHPGDLEFSPTEPVLAVGGADRRVYLVDVSDPTAMKLLGRTAPAKDPITAVAFGPDGTRLAAGGGDVKLWDVDGGRLRDPELVADLPGQTGIVDLAFSPDGRYVLPAGTEMLSTTWQGVDVDEAAARLCQRRGGPISPEEWAEYLPEVPYRDPCD
ncbi:AAA family ATPase [Parafrankia sp. EUN1f]|uniref:nSTAND1 domain-containing NTPase n=1 Tax=Parafrankia sp. EUN1f TaxID=102897 RepID=UPI0001C46D59|nr:AAA family ATPase [Parafrankia sp. EUN1f]EFC79935.1 WD-40 repeat protein [Parafrankia sp. EUN1f]